FQAEDGIRTRTVTGVQTCALPILGWRQRTARVRVADCRSRLKDGRITLLEVLQIASLRSDVSSAEHKVRGQLLFDGEVKCVRTRSEERRVGKECRSMW